MIKRNYKWLEKWKTTKFTQKISDISTLYKVSYLKNEDYKQVILSLDSL